jgi:glyoxylase I family protein
MHLEHVAFNLPAPELAVEWYCQHLGLTVQRRQGSPVTAHFLADAGGKVMLEFYRHATVPAPDYRAIHPQVLHIAFAVTDIAAVRARLLEAGATPEGEIFSNPDGDQLVMLRDPWGVPLQLVQRATPML